MKKRILVVGLVLALVVVLVMPMAALAGSPATDTTLVSGQIAYEYTITVPDDINLNTFATAGDYEATGRSISVSTNDAAMTMCGITVNDIKTNTKGYLIVQLWQRGKKSLCKVHTLVCQAFHGPAPTDEYGPMQCHHKDNDQLNNLATNLEWVTAKENREKEWHRYVHGQWGRG